MNRSGFTTVEVMIASVLIVALITAGTAGIRQLNLISQVATTRTAHTEVRSRVLSVLANTGGCAGNLTSTGPLVFVPPANPNDPIPSIPVPRLMDGGTLILENGMPVPKTERDFDGLVYHLSLQFPMKGPFFDPFKAGMGRPNATRRYAARFVVRGERKNLNDQGGRQSNLFAEIPIYLEFDNTNNRLVSCTTQAEDTDELLAGGNHTVRECMRVNGFPMPTAAGLICRIPVPYQPQIAAGYTNTAPNFGIPRCSTLVPLGGWTEPPGGGPNYNSTLPVDIYTDSVCKNKPKYASTGWHTLSKTAVETAVLRVKKGSSNTLKILLGGGAFVGLVVVAAIPVIGTIIAAAVLLIAFIFSLFGGCKSEDLRFYAQVTGVGCI